MLFKNLFPRGRVTVPECMQESLFPPSILSKTVKYSSQPKSSDWVHQNQLFQRHPRLHLFEERWNKAFHQLKLLVSYVIVSGLIHNPFVMSHILYLSLIESKGAKAAEKSEFGLKIFNRTRNPNLFSWNTMIRFFASFDPVIALDYYTEMLRQEMIPNKYTFPFLLQACGVRLTVESVKQIHCHILKWVLSYDLFVQNSLLNSYLLCDSTPDDGWSVFNEMPDKDVISWTSLISGLVSQSNYCDAVIVFKNLMRGESQPQPNIVTVISTMLACGSLGYTDLTRCFHGMLEKAGWLGHNMTVVNSVIDAYAKCGDLHYVRKLFDDSQSSERDLYSWAAIISGFAVHGRGRDAVDMFSRMEQESKLEPDEVTFVAVLSACAHSGLVNEGLKIFASMSAQYNIEPDIRHYGCIVDLLGRSGMLRQAYDIVKNMPMEPNLAVLGSLLNGCKLHNDLELGKVVLRKIELLNERGGTPVLLSNMYANENQWGKVAEIRRELRGRMPRKPPGKSWIQIKDNVQEFVARNDIDTRGMELVLVLEGLENHSKL